MGDFSRTHLRPKPNWLRERKRERERERESSGKGRKRKRKRWSPSQYECNCKYSLGSKTNNHSLYQNNDKKEESGRLSKESYL